MQTQHDDPAYVDQWIQGCAQAHIPIHEISPAEAYLKEPLLSKAVLRIFQVPDAAVDGFKIVWANAKSARRYGGQYKTYHQVERLLMKIGSLPGW